MAIRVGARVRYNVNGQLGVVDSNDNSMVTADRMWYRLYHVKYDTPQPSRDPGHPDHRYQGVVTTSEQLTVLDHL